MKKLMALFIVMAFSFAAVSQEVPATKDKTQTTPKQEQQMKITEPKEDGLMMKDGKVWIMKQGKGTVLHKEMTLSNGTKVKADGSVVMKDGSQTALREGDHIHMDGRLERAGSEDKTLNKKNPEHDIK